LLLTDFGQDRPTGSEIRSTDLAWKNDFSVFPVAGRPLRSTALSAELSGFLGRPTRSTAVVCRALGISGSTDPVDRASRFCPDCPIYNTFSLSLSLSLFHSRPPSPLSQKFDSLHPSQIPSKSEFYSLFLCWIFNFRAFLRQISKDFQI